MKHFLSNIFGSMCIQNICTEIIFIANSFQFLKTKICCSIKTAKLCVNDKSQKKIYLIFYSKYLKYQKFNCSIIFSIELKTYAAVEMRKFEKCQEIRLK